MYATLVLRMQYIKLIFIYCSCHIHSLCDDNETVHYDIVHFNQFMAIIIAIN